MHRYICVHWQHTTKSKWLFGQLYMPRLSFLGGLEQIKGSSPTPKVPAGERRTINNIDKQRPECATDFPWRWEVTIVTGKMSAFPLRGTVLGGGGGARTMLLVPDTNILQLWEQVTCVISATVDKGNKMPSKRGSKLSKLTLCKESKFHSEHMSNKDVWPCLTCGFESHGICIRTWIHQQDSCFFSLWIVIDPPERDSTINNKLLSWTIQQGPPFSACHPIPCLLQDKEACGLKATNQNLLPSGDWGLSLQKDTWTEKARAQN